MPYSSQLLYIQNLLRAGGLVMYIIAACSLIGLFIILERLFFYYRSRVNVTDLLRGLYNVLRQNNVVEAISICDDTPGPVARVLRAALLRCNDGEAALRRAVREASLAEVPRLEKRLKGLATIAHVAPLLGLLGTVIGMIGAFQAMEQAGPFVSTVDLAKYISKALLTTGAGLTVAIPCYAAYNLLVAQVENLILDMERAAGDMIFFLTHSGIELAPPPVVDSLAD